MLYLATILITLLLALPAMSIGFSGTVTGSGSDPRRESGQKAVEAGRLAFLLSFVYLVGHGQELLVLLLTRTCTSISGPP